MRHRWPRPSELPGPRSPVTVGRHCSPGGFPMTTTAEQGSKSTASAPIRRRRVAGGSIVLWGGTVAIGMSTAVLLAILSRHHAVNFAALSAILGLSFVISLIPSGVQLPAASLAADGFALPRFSPRALGTLAVAGIALSPVLALVLKVPVLAAISIVVQPAAAIRLAVQRGADRGPPLLRPGSKMGPRKRHPQRRRRRRRPHAGRRRLAGALPLATSRRWWCRPPSTPTGSSGG